MQHKTKFVKNSSFCFPSHPTFSSCISSPPMSSAAIPFRDTPHTCFLQSLISVSPKSVSVLEKDVRWSHLSPQRRDTLASGRASIIESEQIFLMCQLQLEEWPEWWITLVRLWTGAKFTQVRVSSTRRGWWHFILPGRHAVHAKGLVS